MMTHLKKLCALPGVSGQEDAVRAYILHVLRQCDAVAEITVDPLGNVLARVAGRKRAAQPVLFAAHMDEVGFIITGVTDEGYCRFAPVGGIDPRVIYGRRVLVNGHPGLIGGKAVHMCSEEEKTKAARADKLLIDIGAADRAQAEQLVQPGDTAVFDSEYTRLQGGLFKARALDDRAGCALLLALAERQADYDFLLAFTVQEEVGLRGAGAAAFSLSPAVAVVVDATTAADTAGVPEDKRVCTVGGGPVLSFMDKQTLYDKALFEHVRTLAEDAHIPTQLKTLVAGGNDAGAIQRTGPGARVAAVSLPCRYLHSPSCVLAKKDLTATLALLETLADHLPADAP